MSAASMLYVSQQTTSVSHIATEICTRPPDSSNPNREYKQHIVAESTAEKQSSTLCAQSAVHKQLRLRHSMYHLGLITNPDALLHNPRCRRKSEESKWPPNRKINVKIIASEVDKLTDERQKTLPHIHAVALAEYVVHE